MLVLDQFLPNFAGRGRILTAFDRPVPWERHFVDWRGLGVEKSANLWGLEPKVESRQSGKRAPGDDEEGPEESELQGRRNGVYFQGLCRVGEL